MVLIVLTWYGGRGGLPARFYHQPRGAMAREATKLTSRTGKKNVTLYLPVETWRELKILATVMDTTMDGLMRRGVDLVLAEHKGKRCRRSRGA